MSHKNPSGLHNRINAVLVESHKSGRPLTGVKIGLVESTYGELEQAYDYICELGFVPETFWKHSELIECFRDVCVDEWKKIFKTPYLDYNNDDVCKLYTKRLKNAWKQMMEHFASQYFVEVISYWMSKGWYVNESDLYSPYHKLEKMAVDIYKMPWLQNYNNKILEEGKDEKDAETVC